ncbi:MAG TPA: MotA/TolQ/ExbB proton channel family protein [Sandaracinaceae bacterium LLY-WYZ-13_1]|nr:MotA/TolQ/ExbB proton channel family protein [Sandaracinaceae bacterium LLY-WYZ-13_1]
MTWQWFASGGPIMGLLFAVGLALYLLLARTALGLASGEHLEVAALTLPRALIGVAPLLGLLGTVSGVIESFEALVSGGPGLGHGIGVALRTTQYGLTLAAPALLWERILSRRIAVVRAEAQARGAA